jgi:hypothetical protein
VTNRLVARDIKLMDTCHICWIWRRQTTSCFPGSRESWQDTQDTFKKELEGAVRSITAADFAKAFWRWFQRREKCVSIGGGYVEKS